MDNSLQTLNSQASLALGMPWLEIIQNSDMLDLLPVAAFVCDMDGLIKGCNEEAIRLWGRKPDTGPKGERYDGAYKLYHKNGDFLPHNQAPAAVCLTNGLAMKDLEIIVERPDQSRIHTCINVSPLRDGKGSLRGVISCLYDITAQKLAEKQLARKTMELQDYVNNANIGLHWVDGDGIIKWANKAELDMLGYPEKEYIGHHISEFHLRQDKIKDILTQLSDNKSLDQYESDLRSKDGTIKTVHISSSVFREEGKFVHTRCFTIDVSEQKKLFQALAESEARYKSLVDSLPVGVYTCNAEGRITFFNEVAVNLWGYRPDTLDETLKYCACFKVFVNDTLIAPDETPMAICLRTGQSFRNQRALVERPDGSTFYASVNIDPIYNEANQVTGAINVFQDITEVRTAEHSRMASESRYHQLIQNLDTPLYTTDAVGKIMMYNQAAVDLWGREPLVGKDMWCGSFKILNTDGSELPLESCPMAVCLKEQRPVHGEEILVMRPDGSLRHVSPHPQPIFDDSGTMTGAVNMLVDITDLKSKEKALHESEAKYRLLANMLEVNVAEKIDELKKSEERYHKMVEEVEDYAIIMLDREGIIVNWNKGAEKIKGYKEEDIIGKSFQEFYLDADRKNGLPLTLLREARMNGKASHEGWRKRKNGTAFWGSILMTALHDEHNNVIGFSKVTRDLTEKKLAEDKTREYLAQLEFQNNELEQFVYAASHDLKEPLRKIHLYNSFVAENPANALDSKSREYLSRSVNAAQRMKGLIEDLLTYSRATANVEGYEELDLNQLFDEMFALHKEEFHQKRVEIHKEDLPVIQAVPFQVKQLFSNLIDNAVKYRHPDRSAHIEIHHELVDGPMITSFMADHARQYYKISVTDNGIGFDLQHVDRIFEIFQRLAHSTGINGSGIGLAICKKIVQNHDGFIVATGKPGVGATFDVYFPKDEQL